MFDLSLVASIQIKTTKVSEHPIWRKVWVLKRKGGADLSQAAFSSSPSQGVKLSSSALVVPVSISAIDALLQPLPGHCSSVIPGKSQSQSFHEASTELSKSTLQAFLGNTITLMEVYHLSSSLRYLEFFPFTAFFPTCLLLQLMCWV